MKNWLKRNALVVLLAGFGLCLLGVGMIGGVFATLAMHQGPPAMPELPLHATATDTGESISMATGLVDEEMEGAFFLDFITGTLSCVVLNSRKADLVAGVFQTNVVKDLGIDESKEPKYLMTTGLATFTGKGRGGEQPARCVVYVCDQNTGNFAGYSLTWNKNKASQGILQRGGLIRLVVNNARAVKNQE